MQYASVAVAKNLDFDVTCLAYESFEINCAVREAFCGKVLGCLYRGYKIFRLIHVALADAATAASRFDQPGVADRRPNIRQTHIDGLGDTLPAGQTRNPYVLSGLPGVGLFAPHYFSF